MITYQEERIGNILFELVPILEKHWEELANHKDIRPLDPDFNTYIKLNEIDVIRVFTARDEGKLIGYASFFISNNLHYKTWKYAVSDVYYLDAVHRATGTGLEMFEEIEKWLKSLEIRSVTVQDKINHSHEKFFLKLGFSKAEQLYEKVF